MDSRLDPCALVVAKRIETVDLGSRRRPEAHLQYASDGDVTAWTHQYRGHHGSELWAGEHPAHADANHLFKPTSGAPAQEPCARGLNHHFGACFASFAGGLCGGDAAPAEEREHRQCSEGSSHWSPTETQRLGSAPARGDRRARPRGFPSSRLPSTGCKGASPRGVWRRIAALP